MDASFGRGAYTTFLLLKFPSVRSSQGMDSASLREEALFTLKIILLGTKPPVWRRIQVLDSINLGDLHYVVQCVMGWDDCHLHQYHSGKKRYGVPCPDEDYYPVHDESQFVLADVLKRKGAKLRYEYDYGDDWQHEIVLESRVAATSEHTHPVCLDGARNCPPEDVGGVWGYAELLESVSDPRHPSRRRFEEWLDEVYDPDRFELDEINKVLKRMKYSS